MSSLQYVLKQVVDEIKQDVGPHVYFLYGDLGVGKTHFIKQVAKQLKIQENIISPTFVILQAYDIPNQERKLVHVDFYRFKDSVSPQLLEEVALYDYLFNDIVFIEWADLIEHLLPKSILQNVKKIKISKDDYGNREYEFIK